MFKSRKVCLIGLLALLFVGFYWLGFDQYIDLTVLKEKNDELAAYYIANPWQTSAWFFVFYIISTAISIPGASILTLAAGAIFGLFWGVILVSFASTIGASLAFLLSRYILKETVQLKFSDKLTDVNAGIKKEGAFYLFTLRLIVLFPFWLVNLLMGLTPIKLRSYFWVSQIGMLPATILFVNAGTQLTKVEQVSDVLSPAVAISFALLGLFPLFAKTVPTIIRRYKILTSYKKPKVFDYNLVVIGGGSAGLVSAYLAAAVNAKVLLIEKNKMGGDCLYSGCVPSKSLIKSSRFLAELSRSKHYGINSASAEFDFAEVMERVSSVIKQIEPHDSVERYTQLGVECMQAEARVLSPWEIAVGDRIISSRHIIVATGAKPRIPTIEGVDQVPYYTSDTIWSLREQPKHLLVVGAGPIGCELGQSFSRLGSKVTLIDNADRIMPSEDEESVGVLMTHLEHDGVELKLQYSVDSFAMDNNQCVATLKSAQGKPLKLIFDAVLFAVGREANVAGLGLQELGVQLTQSGTIKVDKYMRTHVPTIYACGDVAGPYQFTHTAAHFAWYSVVNSLFGDFWRFKADRRVIPRVTFTEPEIASVGYNEQSAKAAGLQIETTKFEFNELDRAIVEGKTEGFVKVLTAAGKDHILGVTIVGEHAGEILPEFVLAMKHGLGLNKILATIHVYPTWAEASKYTAGVWKKNHQPTKLLKILKRYHLARRS
ncbi:MULTISPECIES: FAD-dependent oxidoreductase [Cycloclasticus]|uniref:Pyruvate/2-oxoglutarate dehydrogenase complex dihydrolipoamide dehydrogenase component-like enzyme n=1 Tax=Cycloclasticus pugetii TaxID=34068 RepID=A0AB33YZT6_9GAMM|nr:MULTISPECIES: bifunctional TVP38/TMEM64 family protein/FAD-dependent oxidoreductase [Cycloclasticus]ATI03353.1 pyridine nucleotide-disulfide oxidoreductase [Cycloclasticus sp. PY97N]EPD12599.1 pyruvate/2-oxoglutarate dehydrogenase complex dihydrolipoamide dehydrogenase component-like enzyme [Cycloclasticus pugetii]